MPYLYSALTRLCSISSARRAELFTDPDLLERLSRGEGSSGLHPSLSKAVAKLDWRGCEAEDRQAQRAGMEILPWPDPGYPDALRQIPDPPPALYVLGRRETLAGLAVAVVGSRLSTVYGQNVARMFGQDLAQAGLTVVSGLARGVDTAAHEGSLAVAGHAVAVLGTGLDVPYPRENEPLMRRIAAEGGAVTSEFPPGTPPAPRNFPQRNRVIAGLSWGVLVVEATERSGALITARFAAETDREVFAVPHNITSRTGIGPNTLIQKGAKLAQRAQDILEEVPLSLRCNLKPVLDAGENPAISTLSDAGRRLFVALKPDSGRSLDALCTDTGLSASGVLAALFDLQMAGLCVELPGARYALKRPPKEP